MPIIVKRRGRVFESEKKVRNIRVEWGGYKVLDANYGSCETLKLIVRDQYVWKPRYVMLKVEIIERLYIVIVIFCSAREDHLY